MPATDAILIHVYRDPVGTETQQQVIGALSSILKDMPTRAKPVDSSTPTTGQKHHHFEEIVLGLNAVTRALEKDEVRLVVCTRDLTPARALQHLPVLCSFRSVPLCPLSMTSQSFAELMGASEIRTVICMAFKRVENSAFEEAVTTIAAKCPKIDIPWTPSTASLPSIEATVDAHKATDKSMKAQRKAKFARLKVRKIEHTAPLKPPKTQQKAPKPTAQEKKPQTNASNKPNDKAAASKPMAS